MGALRHPLRLHLRDDRLPLAPDQLTAAAWTEERRANLAELAAETGFALHGIAPAAPDPQTAARLEQWLDQGRAGQMAYLERRSTDGTLLRSAVQVPLPWARSVIVCAFNYNAAGPHSLDTAPDNTGWIARYAWSGQPQPDGSLAPTDYHDDLLARLRRIEAGLQALAPCQTKCYVDTGPLLERDLAAKAGLGWTGKNTCLLNQQQGSWLLLGVIVTSLELPPDPPLTLAPDRCGSCTRCLDACPTGALVAPRQMDASLCIAYLTIEKKGTIPEALREPMGRQVFGCDICQEVCPWNRHAPLSAALHPRPDLINPTLASLAALTPETFRRRFKGSPLERTRLPRIHRNTAIAMGNTADPAHLPQLQPWAQGTDPVLAEAAQWAIRRLTPSTEPPQTSSDRCPSPAAT